MFLQEVQTFPDRRRQCKVSSKERYKHTFQRPKTAFGLQQKWEVGKEINDKKLLSLRQDEKVDLEICMQIREACRRSKALIMEDYNYTSADKAEKKRVPREGGTVREN